MSLASVKLSKYLPGCIRWQYSVYSLLHCHTLLDRTRMTASGSQDQPLSLPSMDTSETEHGLPVVLRRRHRWVSQRTDNQIEDAWGPRGPQRVCQVCNEELPSHNALRLHVNAHFLLQFCPCGYHDVSPYPVTLHKLDCFAGETHVVDADKYPEYLEAIKPVIRKALTWAALSSGFDTLLTEARRKSPLVRDEAVTYVGPDNSPQEVESTVPGETPVSTEPSRLDIVEERLHRLQEDCIQLAPDLLNATTGLYELKSSVFRLKRRLRARQARHRTQSLQK